jgi:hypothetical protein
VEWDGLNDRPEQANRGMSGRLPSLSRDERYGPSIEHPQGQNEEWVPDEGAKFPTKSLNRLRSILVPGDQPIRATARNERCQPEA